MKESFFDEQKEHSRIKAEIISKYMSAWSRVIIPSAKKGANKIGYLDLFAGPGRYKDGKSSTPLMILERAVKSVDLRKMLITVFNDADPGNKRTLEQAINELPDIEKLSYKPEVRNIEVGEALVGQFENIKFIPTLTFIDPCGYKGVSLKLIIAVVKDWACDCLFFLNYKRISAGLFNIKFETHMNAFFGKDKADLLRTKLKTLKPHEREKEIINELKLALKSNSINYFRTFCVKDAGGKRTSHYLVFVSKSIKGYAIMKDIMAKYSSSFDEGVPSFTYDPVAEMYSSTLPLNSGLIDNLAKHLLIKFTERTLSVKEIYNQDHVGNDYVSKNYKDALLRLENESKISVDKPAESRLRKGEITLGDDRLITFPEKDN